MSTTKDWIPEGVKEFDDFQQTFIGGVLTNGATWLINSAKINTLKDLRDAYVPLYTISKNTASATPLDYENTDTARRAYKKNIRVITKQEIKNNSNMTDTDRSSILVHNDAITHTDAPVETDGPAIWFDNGHHQLMFIHFAPIGTTKEHKPKGQAEMVMTYDFYKVGEPVPAMSKCTHHTTFTESAGHLETSEDQYGMMMVCYGQWKNTANKMSPPSIAFTVLVT